MNKYITLELPNGSIYLVGIDHIEVYDGVSIRLDVKAKPQPLGLVYFNNFNYLIKKSHWDRSKMKFKPNGGFKDYENILLPLDKDGEVSGNYILDFESDTDAKLYVEVLRDEYKTK